MNDPIDQRSPMAVAMDWVSRITAIAILMVLPGLVGYWVDNKLGTKVIFTLAGFGFGMIAGMWQLIQETKSKKGDSRSGQPSRPDEQEPDGDARR